MTVMLYTIMLIFLYFCYFYVKCLVVKSLWLSPSIIFFVFGQFFVLKRGFLVFYRVQIEFFLYCRRFSMCGQMINALVNPLMSLWGFYQIIYSLKLPLILMGIQIQLLSVMRVFGHQDIIIEQNWTMYLSLVLRSIMTYIL